MKLCERLRLLRLDRGLRLTDVAEGTGYTTSYLSELERGNSAGSLDTIVTLASFYGLSLRDLLDEVDGFGPGSDRSGGLPRAVAQLRCCHLASGPISEEWLALLGSIEHRGQRIKSAEDALLTYLLLRRVLEGQP